MGRRGIAGWLSAVVLPAAIVAAVAGCGGSSTTTTPSYAPRSVAAFPAGSTMDRLSKAGKITIGVKFDQPGIGEMNPATNKPEGFDIEIAKLIASGLGLSPDQIKFVEAVSANRETFISNGTVDLIIASYSITDQRKQVVSFAGPYYETGQDLMVRKDDNSITGPDSMSGKKVCSVTGSTPLANIQKKYPSATAVPFATYTECVQQLLNGSVDAVTTDGAILLGYAARQPSRLKVIGKPFSSELYGVGLKKDDTQFHGFLNDLLQHAYDDGDWAKAYEVTLGKSGSATPTPPTIDRS